MKRDTYLRNIVDGCLTEAEAAARLQSLGETEVEYTDHCVYIGETESLFQSLFGGVRQWHYCVRQYVTINLPTSNFINSHDHRKPHNRS